jgi:hypothetical protein
MSRRTPTNQQVSRPAALSLAAARAWCAVAARGLPRSVRSRFTEEWRADLAAEPNHALRYATSLLTHVVQLRSAVSASGLAQNPRKPWSCRLRLHRYVTVHDNPDNLRFTSHHCRRCGHIKDDWRGPSRVNDGAVWGASMGIH